MGSRASRHVTQDDAHIFCTEEQIPARARRHASTTSRSLYDLFGARAAGASSRRDPTTSSARTRSGTSPRASSRRRSSETGSTYVVGEGEGSFYGPKIDLHVTDVARPLVADGDDPARQPDAAALRLDVHGQRTTSSTRSSSSTVRCFGSFERFIGILIEHYGGAFPVWLAPVQVRVIPVGEDHREAAHGAAGEARRAPGRDRRARRDGRASGSATPSSRRSPT